MGGYLQPPGSHVNSTNGSYSTQASSRELQQYAQLLQSRRPIGSAQNNTGPNFSANLQTAPLFSWSAKSAASAIYGINFHQYALFGHLLPGPLDDLAAATGATTNVTPPTPGAQSSFEPVFINTNVPFSSFICGKQGSGKSYTLSCMLEGCLLATDQLGKLPQPLSGIVFNYDSQAVNVAEAAYLCSAGVPVTVFVSPSNWKTMETEYRKIPGSNSSNLKIEPLYLKPTHLTTERMKRLMAFGDNNKDPPLYMQTVIKTLRQMALDNRGAASFNYDEFRRRIFSEAFTGHQSGPLELRLDLLESFMEGELVDAARYLGIDAKTFYGEFNKTPKVKLIKKVKPSKGPELLAGTSGRLTIIDLTDPVIDSDSACVLFDICLAIFLEKTTCGKVIALDEAHNYISKGAASDNFTNNILKAVREQRHKGARIIVATQEPTISPKFLDLCSMTIVHAFDSPDWFKALKGHLRGASTASGLSDEDLQILFNAIGDLQVGESLLFSSQALLDVDANGTITRLGGWHKKLMTRPRLSNDGGTSVVATGIDVAVKQSGFKSFLQAHSLSQPSFFSGISASKYARAAVTQITPALGPRITESMPKFVKMVVPNNEALSIDRQQERKKAVPPSNGTASAPGLQPLIQHDVDAPNLQNVFMSITATEMFEKYSFEELRIGDLACGRGGKKKT